MSGRQTQIGARRLTVGNEAGPRFRVLHRQFEIDKARQLIGQLRAFERDHQIGGRGKSIARLSREHAGQDAVEIRRHCGIQLTGGCKRAAIFERRDLHVIVAGERDRPREQVIERRAQRIDVAATIDELGVLHLLVRHVPRRAKALMHCGQFAILVELFHEPEVAELGDTGSGEQDIARLDIAVDEPAMMQVFESHRHIQRDAGGIANGQRAGAIQ